MTFVVAISIYLAFTLLACASAINNLPGRAAKVFMVLIVSCGVYVAVAVFSNFHALVEVLR